MPKGYPSLTDEQKQIIISRIKDKGERVSELAKEFGVQPRNIYNLLSRSTNEPSLALELAKVKREKEALLKIIGELVADIKVGKKNKTINT